MAAKARTGRIDRGVILLVLIIVVVIATVVVAYFTLRTDLLTEKLKNGQPIVLLFCFFGGEESPFFELFLYHPGTHKAADIHIPGNTAALLENLGKYGPASALYRADSIETLRTKIAEMVGIPVPFHVDLGADELSRLVDLLGGVELFVPNPVDVVDGDQRILVPSGSVVLDGDKVLDFLRYSDPQETEIETIDRRQKVLKALLVRTGESASFLLEPRVERTFRSLCPTNLTGRGLEAFVREMGELNGDEVSFARALGKEQEVDGVSVLFPVEDGQLLRNRVAQRLEAISTFDPSSDEELSITVEILNGTSVSGLARRAAAHLESFGIVVPLTAIQNADRQDHQFTVVLDRKGRPGSARRVAELLKCDRVETVTDGATDPAIDVTVILGRDFDGRYVQKN
jgi:anionic cell wall polymer biosynthesis LytR-Cps2A-Psr (LCP) family protein